MSYEKFSPTKSDMESAATKYHGNIAALADHFKVNRCTIYEYFKREPEGKEIIERVRRYNNESDLDLAEYVIRYAMTNHKNNLHLALRASEKVIEKKGHLRDWQSSNNNGNSVMNLSSLNNLDEIAQKENIP